MKKKGRLALVSMPIRPLRLRMDNPSEEVRIEIVPLIDVIFCILTFFILAAVSLSRQQAISVDLPKANTGSPQGRELLVVTLDEFGQVYVGPDPVLTAEEFEQKLQAYRQANPEGVMALYASEYVTYSEVVQVLDRLRQIGGDRVALATLPSGSEQPSEFDPSGLPDTGVPGYTPYPGMDPLNPYGTQNPLVPSNPAQPQLPPNSEQQPPVSPEQTPPTPDTSAAPNSDATEATPPEQGE